MRQNTYHVCRDSRRKSDLPKYKRSRLDVKDLTDRSNGKKEREVIAIVQLTDLEKDQDIEGVDEGVYVIGRLSLCPQAARCSYDFGNRFIAGIIHTRKGGDFSLVLIVDCVSE